VRRQNSDVPGGNVTDAVRERTLRTMGRYADPRAFSDLVVAVRNGVPIRIADIGRAEDGVEEVRSIARLDGLPTVVLDVRRTSGANTIAVIAEVKRAMEAVAKTLPSDVRLEIVRDQSRYI
jgi:HAE1 family hydrophobic/amphiphilic exporter-1